MKEIWKDIPDYKGIYQASNLGRIRTHKNKVTHTKKHGIRRWKQRVLKYKGHNVKTGNRVSLWKNGKAKDFLVARLVATTFLENLINTKMTVNHKDGNRFNNNIENLEWLSLVDNIRHGFETGLYKQNAITLMDEENEEFYFRSNVQANIFLGRNKNYIACVLKRKSNIATSKDNKKYIIKEKIK